MQKSTNPFEFDAAPNLDPRLLVEWFIEDHNLSRFVQSSRNVLINGERGSGKSMILIYNSVRYQKLRHEINNEPFPPSNVGIYIPCNTALIHKQEYRLLPEVEQVILSEHFLAYSIGAAIAKDLNEISDKFSADDHRHLLDEFAYLTGESPSINQKTFIFLQRAIRNRLRNDQIQLGKGVDVKLDTLEASSFFTLIFPILSALKQTSLLKNTHISLLIDDAHDLNSHQKKILNSWIGYRDHSVFSFKTAIAGTRYYDMTTSFGGTILEGHDYITIDLEKPIQNKSSDFGKFAREVVEKRLKKIDVNITSDEFFPENENFRKAIEKFNEITRKEALDKSITSKKAISDYVYKYSRARYFQERSSKANKPPYSGFETIVHLSTGVIRNLLDPCYWMYEALLSEDNKTIEVISPEIQKKVIQQRSAALWEFIKYKLETQVVGCGKTEADQLRNLITKVTEHFRYRLLNHKSEPRVLTFSISGFEGVQRDELEPLLRLAQKAQLIYIRNGPAKDGGGREDYYNLNRMLFPEYGLDVIGQNGRASLKAIDLINAAKGDSIPTENEKSLVDTIQLGVFDE